MAKPKIDLTGQHFGRWTAKEYLGNGKWLCQCECGIIKNVEGRNLRGGKTLSCGCFQKERAAQTQYKNLIGKTFGYLLVIEDVVGANGKPYCKCKCLNCNNIKDIPKNNLANGHTISCGCITSKGEAKIAQILRDNNIIFEQQKSFDSCRFPDTNSLARFDFYLPQYNVLIEYDGVQHFNSKNLDWNTEERFQYTQEHDKIKTNWCTQNNISLIRISYIDYNNLSFDFLKRKVGI